MHRSLRLFPPTLLLDAAAPGLDASSAGPAPSAFGSLSTPQTIASTTSSPGAMSGSFVLLRGITSKGVTFNVSTGVLSGSPDGDSHGDDTISITAANANGSTTQTLTSRVLAH